MKKTSFKKNNISKKKQVKIFKGRKKPKNKLTNVEKSPIKEEISHDDGDEREGMSDDLSEVEEDYERIPRSIQYLKVKNLLPIKTKTGIVHRSHVIPYQDDNIKSEEVSVTQTEINPSFVQSYASQKTSLEDLKKKVALLCTSLVEDPQENMVALRELIDMIQNPSTKMIISERKILLVSLLHVFLDILPSYRIRTQEENKDSKVLLKKETKKLLGYEQTLLKCYKKYIDLLYDFIRTMKHAILAPTFSEVKRKAHYAVGITAVKCMCDLLSSRFSFNHFKAIASKLVPLSIDVNDTVTDLCCRAFEKMFRADKLGEASEDLVKNIILVIKERHFAVPVALLRTFQCLNLREAKPEVEKLDMNKARKEWQKMSRTERRDKKKLKEIDAELKETDAYENVENVKKHHIQTLNKIFWVFFHVLKDGDKPLLIPPALEGLSKFAYLINLEFFDDLNSVLCSMMEAGKLSDVEKLHGVYTLFTILAGQAEALHIDPHKIYCHMYEGLLHLGHSTEMEHFKLILKCIDFNILRKRKKISATRILAFMKRIATVSLQTPVHGTFGLLASLRDLLTHVKGSDILLDSESSLGSGCYLPEIEDPEHCNPKSTALWELHLLKHHYNPAIKQYSIHLLNNCATHGRLGLPEKLARSRPEEALDLFTEVAVLNKMDFLEDVTEPPKKKIKFIPCDSSISYEKDIDLTMDLTLYKNQ